MKMPSEKKMFASGGEDVGDGRVSAARSSGERRHRHGGTEKRDCGGFHARDDARSAAATAGRSLSSSVRRSMLKRSF